MKLLHMRKNIYENKNICSKAFMASKITITNMVEYISYVH